MSIPCARLVLGLDLHIVPLPRFTCDRTLALRMLRIMNIKRNDDSLREQRMRVSSYLSRTFPGLIGKQ